MKWSRSEIRMLISVTLLIALLDQVAKFFVVANIKEGEQIPIVSDLFNLVLAHNRGVAFGIFSNIAHDGVRLLILGITTLLALSAVYLFAKSETCATFRAKLALGMILGGAIGNLIDRVRLGSVVDYLDFYYGTYHWPAFNLADSAICIAVAILLFAPHKALTE